MKWPIYLGASLSAAAYAVWLEMRPRKYHPDVTWPNVTGGIVLTGAWVAVRYAAERRPRSLWWAWWQTTAMFIATGVPVVAWELYATTERGRTLIAYMRDRDAYPAPTAGVQGETPGQHRG